MSFTDFVEDPDSDGAIMARITMSVSDLIALQQVCEITLVSIGKVERQTELTAEEQRIATQTCDNAFQLFRWAEDCIYLIKKVSDEPDKPAALEAAEEGPDGKD